MKARLITIVIIVIGFGTIVNLSRSIYILWQKGTRVQNRQEAYEQVKEENLKLRRKLAEVESYEYVEKQAREKLGMAKEDEHMVILPKQLQAKKVLEAHDEKNLDEKLPAWQQWQELFF